MSRSIKGSTLKKLPTFIILLLFSLTLLVFSTNSRLSNPKQLGMSVISVFQKAVHGSIAWFSDTVNSINELKNLKVEHDKILLKLNKYEKMYKNIEEIRRENELLKEQLNFSKSFEISHIPAEIIAKDPVNIFSSFMIDKGLRHGIRKGMPVTAYQNGIIGIVGKVIDAGYGSSIVLPIYDSTSFVAARFQDNRYEGLINGRGSNNKNLIMNYVKKTASSVIYNNDLIITSGMESLYPKGIYIGRVQSITSQEYNTSLEIEVEPVLDFSKLEYLFVLTGLNNEVDQ
ncbi:MAG: rod shape-determining protein MreC [Spirochaetaceae bacterium 4572_59]|nr:MAG: rod shape-determining protein MreC [Spirochaetaceae bacterium 4572_59]